MKSDVYEIPEKLSDIAAGFGVTDADRNLSSHAIFIHLYKNVTEEWILYAEDTASRDLIFAIIERFFEKYREYVAEPIENSNYHGLPAYWTDYFDRAERLQPYRHFSHFFELLHTGAFAHTRYDLAEAILGTLSEHPEAFADKETLNGLKTDLIGPATDCVFSRASQTYLRSITEFSDGGEPRGVGLVQHLNFEFLQPIWMKKFQGWRQLAWNDAIQAYELTLNKTA